MDSESDDGFARQPGEALDMGDDFDSEDKDQDRDQLSDEEDDEQPQPVLMGLKKEAPLPAAQAKPSGGPQVKGHVVENQHHDLAVDVNDSEEIDSEEEEDEVQMDQQKLQPNLASQQKLQP